MTEKKEEQPKEKNWGQKKKRRSLDKSKIGRPVEFNDEMAARVIQAIATSKLSLRDVCKLDDMPSPNAVFQWLYKNKEFNDQYLLAKKQQQQLIMDDIELEFEKIHQYMYTDKEGNTRIDPPAVALIAKKVEHLRWSAARLAPRVYGDKNDLDEMKNKNQELEDKLNKLMEDLDKANEKEY